MADGPAIGTAYLRVAGDFSQVNSQVVGLFSSQRFSKLGKAAGAGLAAGIAAAGVGKLIYDVGKAFDDAYDRISVQTGATGKELRKLQGDFRAVIKGVPTDFETASKAVAGLNQRLDITGKPLRNLTKQFTELSRITETDVEDNIQNVTRAFADWEVKTRKQGETLDFLFKASQASGASVSELASQVVQFGAPLRQVGFALDEAVAMFAQFEKAGVNTQTMMPGLRMALRSFLEQDIDPRKGLLQTFEGIEDGTIKASEALEIFGARAGADMIEAIRQGRFDLDEFTESIAKNDETVRKAGRRTQDFAEHWLKFKNNVLLALEPVATKVFKALGDEMKTLTRIFRQEGLAGVAQHIKERFADAIDAASRTIAENAPRLAGELVKGFFEANIWTRLFVGAWLLRKMGGKGFFSSQGKTAGRLFAGGFLLAIPTLIPEAFQLGKDIGNAIRGALGLDTKPLEPTLGSGFTRNLQSLDNIKLFEDEQRKAAKQSQRDRERDLKEHHQALGRIVDGGLRRVTDKNKAGLETIESAYEDTRHKVDRTTERQGRDVARNAANMVNAVSGGLQRLGENTNSALKAFGVKTLAFKIDLAGHNPSGQIGFQTGGTVIGGVGDGDKVPVLAEPGEGFLNKTFMQRIGGEKGLNALNALIPRFAVGGMIHPPGTPGTATVNASIAKQVAAWLNRYKMLLTAGYDPGGGHVSPGHNITGTALDTVPSAGWSPGPTGLFESGLMAALRAGKKVLYGSHGVGTPYPNHGFGNHAHTEWGMGGAVAAMEALKRIILGGPAGPLREMGQSSLDRARKAANAFLSRQTVGLPVGAHGEAGGPFGKAGLMKLWNQTGRGGNANLMAAIALAESGGNPNVTNSIGARGLWQIIPSTAAAFGLNYARLTDPVLNARGAHAILAGQGLGAWEAYTNGAYAQFLQQGGIVQRLAQGGTAVGQGAGGGGRGTGKVGGGRLRDRLRRVMHDIARTDERIQIAESLAGLETSSGGSGLSASEKSQQIALYERLFGQLSKQRRISQQGLALSRQLKMSPTVWRDSLRDVAGLTGKGGRLFETSLALSGLRATPLAGSLGISIEDLLRITDVARLGIPIMHGGGTFRAPRPGGEGLAVLKDRETVAPPGGAIPEITLVIEDGAVDANRIRVIANGQIVKANRDLRLVERAGVT